MGSVGFGKGNRAAVGVICAVFKLSAAGRVEMPVKKDVPLLQKRGIFPVEQVSVGKEKGVSVLIPKRIIGKNGKFKHHLVDFTVAISAHAKNFLFDGVEHCKNLFRGIIVGKIVAGTVIEQVAKQDDLIRAFVFKSGEKLRAPICRAVNIRSNDKFHTRTYVRK